LPDVARGGEIIIGSISDFTVKLAGSAIKLTTGLFPDHAKYDIAIAGANINAAGSKITDATAVREIIASSRVKIPSLAGISGSGRVNQSHSGVINLIQ
jgi:hypothetical protein